MGYSPFLMNVRRTPQRDKVWVFSLSHLRASCSLSQKMRLNWRGGYLFLTILIAVFQIRYGRTYNVHCLRPQHSSGEDLTPRTFMW